MRITVSGTGATLIRWMGAVLVVALFVQPACAHGSEADRTVQVSPDDREMNAAIGKARATLETFISALHHPKPSQSLLSLKVRITDGTNVEHFWLTDVTYDGETFRGRISNDPETVKSVKFGEAFSARRPDVSDWMYVEDGKLVGGYTVRVLYDRLSPADRAEFDKSLPYRVN